MGCIWRVIRTILVIIGAITVIIAIIIGVGFYLLTRPSALEKEMTPIELTPAEATAAVKRFDTKIDTLEAQLEALKSGDPIPPLTLTQEEVTAKIADEIEKADIPVNVERIWVNFKDDKVLLLGTVNVGVDVSAGVVAGMEITEEGEPKVVLDKIDIGGGVPVPKAAKDQIAAAIPSEEALTEMIRELPIKITDIDIRDGKLTFKGFKR